MSEIFQSSESNEENWISVSDLMAGLMIVFLFIAIAYITGIGQQQAKLEKTICTEIKETLQDVVSKEKIEICDDGIVVRFKEDESNFDLGQSTLKPEFKRILQEFFPRYLVILEKYQTEIDEVRIEGHTDDIGRKGLKTKLDNYIYNIELSQDRTRSVLRYIFGLPASGQYEEWLITNMTANGLSHSKPIYQKETNNINRGESRRVEFKIRLKTPKRIREIAEAIYEN